MKTAVIFGAGKMAGGLIGHVLWQSGYAVQFVARRPEVIDSIRRHGGYELNIAGQAHPLFIDRCSALDIRDTERVIQAVADADLVFTALGIDNLAAVVGLIGDGLFRRCQTRRGQPLNVIACENLPGTGAYLQHQVLGAASTETVLCIEGIAGFSAAITRRVMTGGSINRRGRLAFTVDSEHDLIIDQRGLRSDVPPLAGAVVTADFTALVMRKFFTVNCAQAVAAYLGYQEGCQSMREAMAHPRVAPLVRAALTEATAALKAEFPSQRVAIEREASEALARLTSDATGDSIQRVAREPRRKLSPRERLLGPALLARRHGLSNLALAHAIAAALAYDAASDPQAIALQQAIAAESLDTVLTEDCGLLPHEELARSIKHLWRKLASQRAALEMVAA